CAGMTIQKLPETKKLKPNGLDSRFRGNDGISVSVRINLDSHLRGNDGILDCGYLSGTAAWKFIETEKQRKPKKPDSRLWE
ncbi:TPA: hypothetical protein ACFOMJ_001717, partial [Neisseria meningitidis]